MYRGKQFHNPRPYNQMHPHEIAERGQQENVFKTESYLPFSTFKSILPAETPIAPQIRKSTSTVGDFSFSSNRLTYWRDTPASWASCSCVISAFNRALRISFPSMHAERSD